MSASGHKRTFATQKGMSALSPKADMCGALAHVRYGPKADNGWTVRSLEMSYTTHAAIMSTVPIKQPSIGVLNQHRQAITVKAPPTTTKIGFSHETFYARFVSFQTILRHNFLRKTIRAKRSMFLVQANGRNRKNRTRRKIKMSALGQKQTFAVR